MFSGKDKTVVSALRFLSGENSNVCRLCLQATAENGSKVNLEDDIALLKPYCNESVTLTQMFYELGISLDPSLPPVLCVNCSNITSNCYLFYKLVEYSNKKWTDALNGLEESLKKVDNIKPFSKTAYLLVKNGDCDLFTSKKKALHNKKKELAKIRDIMKCRSKYAKLKKTPANVKCDQCGVNFKCIYSLKRHIVKIHESDEAKVTCKKCMREFRTLSHLQDHKERVHMPKILQCPSCPKKYATEKLLKFHTQQSHIAHICKICFQQIPSKIALNIHMDQHDIVRCPFCKKTFKHRHSFKSHSKICKEIDLEPAFFCDLCNKGYIRKNGLRTHIRVSHGFGRTLPCNWCDKKFDSVSRLKYHIVKHTKEKNFHCEVCGGRFVTPAALVYHTRLHTGEKPFKCDMCDESFLSASRRMAHKYRKHIGPTKECSICNSKFLTQNELSKHQQRHYNPQSKLYVPEINAQITVYEEDEESSKYEEFE